MGEKVLCFMTYNEFFEFFFNALIVFRCVLKKEANNLSETTSKTPQINKDDIKKLKKLYFQDIDVNRTIAIDSAKQLNCYKYIVPNFSDIIKASAKCFCPILFSSINLNAFYQILCWAFIEGSIIFVSQNLNLLTSASYTPLS